MYPLQSVKSLAIGAFVQNGKLYVDKAQLLRDFKNSAYVGLAYTKQGLAKVESTLAFQAPKDYYKFVFERAVLRDRIPFSTIDSNKDFNEYFLLNAGKVLIKENEAEDVFLARQKGIVYEEFLRDRALDNILNGWKLFRSQDTYAEQFFRLYDQFPTLKEKFAIMNSLVMGENRQFKNLKLSNTMLDAEKINILHENLIHLSRGYDDQNRPILDNPQDNKRVADFFTKFTDVAFLQSGLNAKSTFSLVRLVPQDKFLALMKRPVDAYVKHMNPTILDEYLKKFIINNSLESKSARNRYKDYSTDLTLAESIKKKQPVVQGSAEPLTPYSEGIVTYDPTITRAVRDATGKVVVKPKLINNEHAQILMRDNPNTIFVFNDAMIKGKGVANQRDWSFSGITLGNKMGLPTMNTVGIGTADQIEDGIGPDKTPFVKPEVKAAIDNAIQNIKTAIAEGSTIAFNTQGYGQPLIAADPDDAHRSTKNKIGRQTFIYLSQELYKNFGFINPNFLASPEGLQTVQADQDVTDEMVKEFMKHCFS